MILLIADSICGGFGQRDKKSFIHLAAEQLNVSVWDESATGMSSRAYLEYLRTERLICPEQQKPVSNLDDISIVLISLGNVDGKKVYKNNNLFGDLVPSRYRKEKIDPRPYYSNRVVKRFFEKLDNLGRHFFRYYAFISGNLEDTVPFKETVKNIDFILDYYKSKKIILISTSTVNGFYFPGASRNFSKINKYLHSKKNNNIEFFNIQDKIEKSYLLKDKFHLSAIGHAAMKQKFISFLLERLYL